MALRRRPAQDGAWHTVRRSIGTQLTAVTADDRSRKEPISVSYYAASSRCAADVDAASPPSPACGLDARAAVALMHTDVRRPSASPARLPPAVTGLQAPRRPTAARLGRHRDRLSRPFAAPGRSQPVAEDEGAAVRCALRCLDWLGGDEAPAAGAVRRPAGHGACGLPTNLNSIGRCSSRRASHRQIAAVWHCDGSAELPGQQPSGLIPLRAVMPCTTTLVVARARSAWARQFGRLHDRELSRRDSVLGALVVLDGGQYRPARPRPGA